MLYDIFFQLFVEISCCSEEYLNLCLGANLIQPLLAELSGQDLLVQLNILELLRSFSLHRHTMLYLINQGILDQMNQAVATRNDNPTSNFLMSGKY